VPVEIYYFTPKIVSSKAQFVVSTNILCCFRGLLRTFQSPLDKAEIMGYNELSDNSEKSEQPTMR
jgi:hypothetical protein